MDRRRLRQYIAEVYNVDGEFPWEDSEHMVFRHRGNRKWFALILDAPKRSLGLQEEGRLDVLNVKCGPVLSGTLRGEPGIFPAYHMNKSHWVSIALDGSADEAKLKLLLDTSFDLTAPKPKKQQKASKKGEDPHGF